MDTFLEEYSREFEITGGELMSTFLGLQVDQVQSEIHLHMDNYVSSIPLEYKDFIRKTLRPKALPV
jgi:hypothetical protein